MGRGEGGGRGGGGVGRGGELCDGAEPLLASRFPDL